MSSNSFSMLLAALMTPPNGLLHTGSTLQSVRLHRGSPKAISASPDFRELRNRLGPDRSPQAAESAKGTTIGQFDALVRVCPVEKHPFTQRMATGRVGVGGQRTALSIGKNNEDGAA